VRTTRTPRTAHVLAGGVLALVLAGCGGDAAEPAASPAAQAPTTDEDPPAGDPGEVPEGGSTDGGSTDDEPADTGGASETEVALLDDDGFVFAPTEITVAAGDTVTWVHEGRISHTVTAEDGSFDSGPLAAGDTFEVTLDEPGTYAFVCAFHGSMRGTVTVAAS
jgi:plastocyanin